MAVIVWDQIGERRYETGVDRGVLYLPGVAGVPWNGLVSVTDQVVREAKSYHMDGVKYLEQQLPGDFGADLKAFTYPEEFDSVNGLVFDGEIIYHDQMPGRFGLTYRTKIGDDLDADRGYKIHIMWNLLANPVDNTFTSIGDKVAPNVFGWKLSGMPERPSGYRPTCHVSIDSTKVTAAYLQSVEDKLYGTAATDPVLPTLTELQAL